MSPCIARRANADKNVIGLPLLCL